MDRKGRRGRASSGLGPPSETYLFAQALLGRPIPNPAAGQAEARAQRERLEWLADISTEHEQELRRIKSAQATAAAQRRQLEWLATISTRHEEQLWRLLTAEAEARDAQACFEQFDAAAPAITEWNEADHPRAPKGTRTGGQWVSKGGAAGVSPTANGSAGSSGGGSTTRPNLLRQRDAALADAVGVPIPSRARADRLISDVDAALRLPGDIATAVVPGLGTGAKAVVNAAATAIKNVATLGLSSSQLELIGVTDEDRERGYNTAVTIATASGEVLIAVGTAGTASALSKGGTVARSTSGALVAFDAAGNAVGVVRGTYDASQNGVTLSNGAQIAGGALGLGANISSVNYPVLRRATVAEPRNPTHPALRPAPRAARFVVGKHGEMPSPRPGEHSHHGVMSAWMERHYLRYDPDKAPAILMPAKNHRATYPIYLRWRAKARQRMKGKFDWANVTETEIQNVSERMFDAAQVPTEIRQSYWRQFDRMKAALATLQASESWEIYEWPGRHIS